MGAGDLPKVAAFVFASAWPSIGKAIRFNILFARETLNSVD